MKLGSGLGAGLVLLAGTVYLALLRAPGAWFYLFAVIVFVIIPIVAAATAGLKTPKRKLRSFLAAGSAIFGLAAALLIFTYAVYPQFERTSVQLPAVCSGFDNGPHPPASFAFALPGVGTTTLVTSDAQTALVASIDFARAPFASTVYLIQKSDGGVLWSRHFDNDLISAAIEAGTLYLYNDKLGYWIDARTGQPMRNYFTIDNFGGLSPTDRPVLVANPATGRWYQETTAIISSWRADGSVISLGHLTFNNIAFNCFVDGATGSVTPL